MGVGAAWGSGLALVGGEAATDPGGPAVAIVDRDGAQSCSGAVLHPEWALTAAHCAELDLDEVRLAVNVDQPLGRFAVADVIVHPDWDGHADDVALVRLADPAPGPFATLSVVAPAVGDTLVAWGYGDTTDGAGDGGTKRSAALDVLDVDDTTVRTYTAGANLCTGDSGGPLVVPGTWTIAAVAGFVDPTCLGGLGGSARADRAAAFVDEWVPAVPVLPEAPAEGGSGCGGGAAGLGVPLLLGRRRLSRGSGGAAPRPAATGG